MADLATYPGGRRALRGLAQLGLREWPMGEDGLWLLMASGRLRAVGVEVPLWAVRRHPQAAGELFARLEARLGPAAHPHFLALREELVSLADALS